MLAVHKDALAKQGRPLKNNVTVNGVPVPALPHTSTGHSRPCCCCSNRWVQSCNSTTQCASNKLGDLGTCVASGTENTNHSLWGDKEVSCMFCLDDHAHGCPVPPPSAFSRFAPGLAIAKPLANGDTALLLVNRWASTANISVALGQLQLGPTFRARDMVQKADLGEVGGCLGVALEPHASRFLRLTPAAAGSTPAGLGSGCEGAAHGMWV